MHNSGCVEHVSGFRRWIDRLNNGEHLLASLVPFQVAGQTVGFVEEGFSKELLPHGVFQAASGSDGATVLTLDPALDDEAARTAAVAGVMSRLAASGRLTGVRNELYPVAARFGEAPLLLLERAAAPLFGIKAYGVHMNGFVRKPDGLHLWVAKRSDDKPTWPGKFDHIAAGGQPHGLSLRDNVAKECWEEAGIPEALARSARPCGAVSYTSWQDRGRGLKRDVLFVYDIELPGDFTPVPQDGEVQSFELVHVDGVMRTVADTDMYKDNCNLALIDFFVRHGLISADAPGYLDLISRLRAGDCS